MSFVVAISFLCTLLLYLNLTRNSSTLFCKFCSLATSWTRWFIGANLSSHAGVPGARELISTTFGLHITWNISWKDTRHSLSGHTCSVSAVHSHLAGCLLLDIKIRETIFICCFTWEWKLDSSLEGKTYTQRHKICGFHGSGNLTSQKTRVHIHEHT